MIKRETLIMSGILAVSIAAVAVVAALMGGVPTWPGYFLVLLFFLGKCERLADLKDVGCGGAVGIVWSLGCSLAIGTLAPALGQLAALGIVLFASIFLLAALGDVCPLLFNNYAFVYYLIAALFAEQATLAWLASLVGFGAPFALMVFGGKWLLIDRPAQRRDSNGPLTVTRL